MSIPLAKSSPVFLVAIGEMSARIRDFDWAATPLGPIEQWSSSLRAAVALITASPVPNILVCGPGRVLIYNDACFELYGDKHPGALGSKGPDVFPKLWDELGPLFDRVFAGEQLRLEAHSWGDRPRGSLYDTFVAPGRNEAGHVECVYVTAIDVTERAKTEAALRDNEEEYRTLLTSMGQGFCIIEKLPTSPGQPSDYRYILANPAFKQQTGLNDVVGKTTQDLFPDAKATFLDRYDDILKTGRSHVFQDYTDTVDRWIEVEAFAARKPGQVAVLFSDISDKKRAEAALRESEKRQAFLLKLSDALRPLNDPVAVQEATARMLGIELAVERCYYAEFDWPRDVLTIDTEYLRTPSFSVIGEHPISAFQDLLRHSHKGEPLVCDEIAVHPLYRAEAAAYRERGTDGFILVPLVKEGIMVACMCVTMSVPRKWTNEEVEMVREVQSRTWDAVERARAEAELRTAEESHRAIFNGTSAGFLLLAPDTPRFTIKDVNEAYLSATMTRREDLIGRPVFEVFPENPDDPNATNVRDLRASLDRVLTTKRRDALPRLKYGIPKPGGGFEERWWDPIQTPLLGLDGAVTAIIHHATEQTQVERAEAGLRKSEERFRALATAGATSVYRMSPDWQVMHQLDSTNFLSTVTESFEDWREHFILPADRAVVDTAIALAIRTDTMFDLEHRVMLADGGIGWVHSRAVPIRGKGGALVEWFGAATNVTRRKAAEAALQEGEEKYRSLFETMSQGYGEQEIVRDEAGRAIDLRLIEANARLEVLTGLSRASTVGKLLSESVPGLEPSWIERLDKVVLSGEPGQFEDEVTALGRWYKVHVYPRGGDRVALLYDDITERKRAEKTLHDSEQRQAFLLKLSDALRPLYDSIEIKAVAARLLGEQLGVNRAFYADVDKDQWLVTKGYEVGVEPLPDVPFAMATYGQWFIEDFEAGRRWVVRDSDRDDRFDKAERTARQAVQIAASVAVPLVKHGALTAMLVVQAVAPRDWSEQELALVDETAERTWAAVERARAEAELRESEAALIRVQRIAKVSKLEVDVTKGLLGLRTPDYLAMHGVTSNEPTEPHAKWRERVHPDDRDGAERTLLGALNGTTSHYENEYRIIRQSDKAVRWVRAVGDIERVAGTAVRLVGAHIDVTDQKRMQDALRESEERQAFLLRYSDALRPLTDTAQIKGEATRLLREHFEAEWCYYVVYRDNAATAIIEHDSRGAGLPSLVGVHDISDSPDFARELESGRLLNMPDVSNSPLLSPRMIEKYTEMGLNSVLVQPLVKEGRLVAALALTKTEKGPWPDAAIFLISDVAERTWASLERALAEAELRESEERLRHIVESATEYAIVTLDSERRVMTWNSGAQRILGYTETEARGQLADMFFIAEDLADGAAEREMYIAKTTGRAENERWHVRKDGSRFWGSGVMLPIEIDRKGHVIKIFRDRTDNRLAEERQHVLINELNHRVKNTLATVQAMASQTLRGSSVAHDISESFEARLLALANGHDVLTQQNWQGGDLREIARIALGPFCTDDERVHINGPSFYVKPKVALALTMAFHELATNATKYGALSNGSGRIEIAWTIDQSASRLRLRWAESGGPPVATPSRKGFGSRLIERSLAGELDAEARIEYALSGVVCTINAPIATIVGADVGQGLG